MKKACVGQLSLNLPDTFFMNWPLIIIVGIAVLALIIFLFVRNLKDEKKLEKQIENDYQKPRNDKGDIEIDDTRV